MDNQHLDGLVRSPATGRIRIVGSNNDLHGHGIPSSQHKPWRHLLRPNGQPVTPLPGCREPVLINVYDLHWINSMARRLRLAAYHSGVELHGVEMAYGDSGVFTMPPRDINAMEAEMAYRKSVRLGCTDYSREDAMAIGEQLGRAVYTGPMYDLLRRNCNHFSAALARLLCPHAEFPGWINSLAKVSVRLPLVERSVRHFVAESEEEAVEETGSIPIKGDRKRRSLREVCANLSRSSACRASKGLEKQQTQ